MPRRGRQRARAQVEEGLQNSVQDDSRRPPRGVSGRNLGEAWAQRAAGRCAARSWADRRAPLPREEVAGAGTRREGEVWKSCFGKWGGTWTRIM